MPTHWTLVLTAEAQTIQTHGMSMLNLDSFIIDNVADNVIDSR